MGYVNIKYGMKMTMTTLNNFLTDTLLYGEYKGVADYVEPYITKERFDRIQDIMKRNSRVTDSPRKTFLFSGLVKCPCCGNNLTGNYQKNDGYDIFSYRCNAARTRKICTFTKSISERKIEKQLLDNLAKYIDHEIVRVQNIEDIQPKNNNFLKRLRKKKSG